MTPATYFLHQRLILYFCYNLQVWVTCQTFLSKSNIYEKGRILPERCATTLSITTFGLKTQQYELICDTQHNSIKLSVAVVNAVMLSVVAP